MADPDGPDPDDLQCKELADSLTEYLDGELDEDQRRSIERHLGGCPGCRAALEQIRTVIRLTGRLTAADVERIDVLTRERLMATLRVMRRR
jgi:anti-sigma factor (TIGR02949 family)